MITRVSEQMRFSMLMSSLTKIEVSTAKDLEQISSEKKVNRPSDDPVGTGKILNYRTTLASIDQYQTNITDANTWASMTETSLSDVNTLISQATDIGSSYTSGDTDNSSLASSVQSIMDTIMTTANTKLDNRYLFSGSMTGTKPFTDVTDPTITAGGTNKFDGQTVAGGVFTENANKDYLVEIVNGGSLGTATYHISSDGGATWGTTSTVPSSGTINLTDSAGADGGLTLTFVDDGTTHLTSVPTRDQFTVHAVTSAAIKPAVAATGNTYAGTVTSGTGPYTGTTNKTYTLKITTAGVLNTVAATSTAAYSYSSDGGKTWTVGGTIPTTGVATLAGGVTLNFTSGTFAVNDMFTADAKAPGFYNGNDDSLTVDTGQGKTISCNIPGDTAFSDVFASLKGLKAAILSGDSTAVEKYTNQLEKDQTNITGMITTLGFKEQTLNTWSTNYSTLANKISDLKSKIEDTDMTTMIADYKMKETALEAAYTIASKIGSLTILDYLK
jgi:flagellar hook-associated protein 3 FlgL